MSSILQDESPQKPRRRMHLAPLEDRRWVTLQELADCFGVTSYEVRRALSKHYAARNLARMDKKAAWGFFLAGAFMDPYKAADTAKAWTENYKAKPRNIQISMYQRDRIVERDKSTCRYCGKKLRGKGMICLDHVVPRAHGGKNEDDNLVVSCHPCNHKKKDRLLEDVGMVLRPVPAL